jgi:D-alanyl-D-alanine carboxypeptidase (penicillin-binding protein 5/6)
VVDTKIEASFRPAQKKRRSRLARLLTTLSTLVLLIALVTAGVLWARGAFWAPVRLDQRIAGTFTVPGTAPVLPWPTQGQAYVDVVGVGSLGSSGPANAPAPIASITKTMTAYQVLHDHPLSAADGGPTIQVTRQLFDASRSTDGDESGILIQVGEQLTEREALEGILLPSAGNMARLLAAWDAGSVQNFVARMNTEAHALGMAHTTYADPAGIDSNSKSTAADQVKLGEHVLQNATLAAIVSEKTAHVPAAGVVTNTNHLLGVDGDVGIKTGSTSEAGGCLLFAIHTTVDAVPVTLVGAVLGQPGLPWTILKNAETASKTLIEGAESSLTVTPITHIGSTVAVLRQRGHSDVPLTSANDVNVVGWPSLKYKVAISPDHVLSVDSTLMPGTVVGATRLAAR